MNLNAMNTMSPGLKTGDKLAHFEVQEQLFSGGMGIVWKGYDRLLGRHVAIKQIADAARVDEVFREKFRREAEIQKKLSHSHPNIVSIIDFIDEPRGLFIVMEFVEGLSLDRLIAQQHGPIEPLRALTILRDVALALTAIHAAGIVHRDLKPGNIMVPPSGPARVCDFGMATLLTEQDAVEMGTTQYMAPELFGGGPVDARADIYSLGMVAYEMLAGRAAYDEAFKAIVRDERHRAMRWMKWHTNPRISAPPLNSINDMVPPVLSDLVARMMAKDPTQRIGSAPALLEAVKRHFSKSAVTQAAREHRQAAHAAGAPRGVPGPAAHPGELPGAATAALPRRKLWPIVLAVLVGAQLLGIGGYFVWRNMQKNEARLAIEQEANQQFNAAAAKYAAERYAEAQPLFEALAAQWGNHPILGVTARGYAMVSEVRQMLARAEQLMADLQFEEAAKLHDAIENRISEAQLLQLPSEAGRLSETIDKLRDESDTRRAFNTMARDVSKAIANGDFDGARRRHRTLTLRSGVKTSTESAVLEELGTRIEGQQANAMINDIDARAANLVSQRKLTEARDELDKGLRKYPTSAKLQERRQRVENEILYAAAMASGQTAEARGDLATAVLKYQEASKITPDRELNDRIAQLRSQLAFNEGQALEKAGNLPGAAAKYEQASSLWENPLAQERLKEMKLAGDKSAVLAAADTAAAAGDFESAAALFQKALEIAPDPQTQMKLNEAKVRQQVKLAEAALGKQDLAAARAALQAALAVNPEDAQAKAMLSGLENVAKFNELVKAGDEARAESDYVKAKKFYTSAIELAKAANIDAAAVRAKWTDTEYDQLIAQARTSIEFGQIVQARGLLIAAQKMKSTEQVQTLLKEVEDREAAKKR